MILTRWDNLQTSEQELIRLAQTTTSTASSLSIADFVQKNIGHLIRQERALDSEQFNCLYQNVNSDSPVQLVCDLGCCSKGCCAVEEMAQSALGYGWAIGLLVIFIMLVIFVLGMVGLHLLTRSKSPRPQKFENGMYSASNSQISGPVYYNSRQLFQNQISVQQFLVQHVIPLFNRLSIYSLNNCHE
ncbi:hypothetical protein M3Y97_00842000 [Aphelenchoides bicaudatus]|nr:hypothetical protein M3Y97_00842000 [Aphelenchoides bicaudatus]